MCDISGTTSRTAFALIITADGELEIEPGPAFGAADLKPMIDSATAVKDTLSSEARAS